MAIGNRLLRWLNVGAAGLHLASAIVILASDRDWRAPIYIPYTSWGPLDPDFACFDELPDGGENTCVINQAREKLGTVSLKAQTATFFLLSAVFQGAVAIPGAFEWYIAQIDAKFNVMRWAEYAISASLMGIIVAQLNGVQSLWTQLLIFTSLASTMLFGLLHEHMNALVNEIERTRQQWLDNLAVIRDMAESAECRAVTFEADQQIESARRSKTRRGGRGGSLLAGLNEAVFRREAHLFGWIPYLATWGVLMGTFIFSITKSDTDPPAAVATIIYGLFGSFTGFAVNQALQFGKVWLWRDYRFGELNYIILSYTSKSLLAWTLYTGAWFRDGRVESA